jgi:hypothetical protein
VTHTAIPQRGCGPDLGFIDVLGFTLHRRDFTLAKVSTGLLGWVTVDRRHTNHRWLIDENRLIG